MPSTLWEITRACEKALDAYEGFPHLYVKERIAVALPNGRRVKPMAYVMNGPRRRDHGPASDGYLAAIADGYRDFGFDDLAPLRAAQVEAITLARRAERAAWRSASPMVGLAVTMLQTTSLSSVAAAVPNIRYMVRSGCEWPMLPVHFPPWQTVYF